MTPAPTDTFLPLRPRNGAECESLRALTNRHGTEAREMKKSSQMKSSAVDVRRERKQMAADMAAAWLSQHGGEQPVADLKAERKRIRLERYQQERNRQTNAAVKQRMRQGRCRP
jgi:hypothetical protein